MNQVGQAKDELLTNQLIDHLMGESDGMPKVQEALHCWVFTPQPRLVWSSLSVMTLQSCRSVTLEAAIPTL